MKNLIAILLVSVFLFSFCEKPAPSIQGAWQMVYQKFTTPDTTVVVPMTSFANPQIKIFTQSHFAFGFQDSTQVFCGGGTYTLNGTAYVETVLYSSMKGLLNKSFSYTMEIKNDTLYQFGYLDVENKEQLLEKYIPLE